MSHRRSSRANGRLVRIFSQKNLRPLIFAGLLVSIASGALLLPRSLNPVTNTAEAASADIVISQVYGGGGNTGATYKNDFIELFNRGNVAVSVAGWSVQYASAAGSSWASTALTGTIQPGQHYLVQESQGAGGTTNLPTPDATGTLAMSGTAGKVALVTSTTLLTCGATNNCTSVGTVKDFVGFGSTASSFEGSGPTPAPSNTTSVLRQSNGCVDSDSNATDFVAGTVNPRNTAAPVSSCTAQTSPTGTGSANPNNPNPNTTVVLTVAVSPGTNPTSTGITVVADLTPIGGSSTQSFLDDGLNGDAAAGDNIFTFSANSGASGGIKTINFTVADDLDRGSTGSFQLTVQAPSNPSGTGSANPNSVLPGGSTTLTFNVTPGTLPTSTGITVTADLSSIGGSATQAFTDSGNNTTFTYAATVSNGTSAGFKSLPVTINDAQARTGSGTIGLTVLGAGDPSHVPAEHEALGNPSPSGNTDNNDWLLERNQYVLSYNCSKGIPNWVEWHLDPTWIGSTSRQDNYRPDTIPPLPNGCYLVQDTDYSGSGFDRGHNVPSGDRTSSVADNSATFLMTNFIPQAPNNNQGPWNNLEAYIRTQVTAGNEVYTWMGNAGQGGSGSNGGVTTTIAGGHVVVPAYVWRVVVILPSGSNDVSRVDTNTRAFAVLTPNVQTAAGLNTAWQTYVCPISQIEQLTGFTFFPNVPAATAKVLKAKVDSVIQTQSIGAGTYTNLSVAYPQNYLQGNVTVNGVLALGPNDAITTNSTGTTNYKITLAPGATVTRLNSGFVNGTLEKQFSAPNQSFTYPVGTQNGYSPVTANLTALGTNPSSLAVKAIQGAQPNANPQSTALKRYWTLTETGDLTTNLVFNYLDIDVPAGTQESSLQLNKYEGFWTQQPAVTDTTANTASTTSPVSAFSDWTLLPALAPTAANVTVSGRVFAAEGSPLRGARVTINDGAGHMLTAITNSFGYYSFASVPAGTSYLLSSSAKGYTFTPRVVTVNDQLADLDITALP